MSRLPTTSLCCALALIFHAHALNLFDGMPGSNAPTQPSSTFASVCLWQGAWTTDTKMARRRDATSVKAGRLSGSVDQHCSISFLHSGLHEAGTGGRSVLLKIPPAYHHQQLLLPEQTKRPVSVASCVHGQPEVNRCLQRYRIKSARIPAIVTTTNNPDNMHSKFSIMHDPDEPGNPTGQGSNLDVTYLGFHSSEIELRLGPDEFRQGNANSLFWLYR